MPSFLLLPLEILLAQCAMIWKSIAVYFATCSNITYVRVFVVAVLTLYILFVMYNQVSIQLRFPLEMFATFWLKAHKASHFKVNFTVGFQLTLEDETMTSVSTLVHVVCMSVSMLCKGSG